MKKRATTYPWLEYFLCRSCHGRLRVEKGAENEKIVCRGCGERYARNEFGIPLVTDAEKLEKSLPERRKHKETWYSNDQVYPVLRGPYRHIFRHRAEYWTNKLRPYLDKHSVVLDYGCGDGSILSILVDLPHKILLGMDYNIVRLNRASKTVALPDAVVFKY